MTKRLKKGKAYKFYNEEIGDACTCHFAFIVLSVHWYKSKFGDRVYSYVIQVLWDKSKDNLQWEKGEIIDGLVFDTESDIVELKESEWVLDAM